MKLWLTCEKLGGFRIPMTVEIKGSVEPPLQVSRVTVDATGDSLPTLSQQYLSVKRRWDSEKADFICSRTQEGRAIILENTRTCTPTFLV